LDTGREDDKLIPLADLAQELIAVWPFMDIVQDWNETLIHSLAKGGRMSSGHMVEVKLSIPTTTSLSPGGPKVFCGALALRGGAVYEGTRGGRSGRGGVGECGYLVSEDPRVQI
jgi:hypothetical protein